MIRPTNVRRPGRRGGIRGRAAALAYPLDDHSIVVAAMKRADHGIADHLVSDTDLQVALNRLCRSLADEAGLSFGGRRAAHLLLVDLVTRRAAIDATRPEPRHHFEGLTVTVGLPADPIGSVESSLDLADPGWELRWHVPSWVEWCEESFDHDRHLRWIAGHRLDEGRHDLITMTPLRGGEPLAETLPGARIVVDASVPDPGPLVSAAIEARAAGGSTVTEEATRKWVEWRWEVWSSRLAKRAHEPDLDVGPV